MAPNTPRASVTRRAASAVKSSPSRTTRRSSSTPIDIASATTRGPSRRARPGSRRRASLRNLRTTSFSGLSISWLEAFLSNLHQPSKGTAVAHGQVSQHLAVDLHSGLAKAVHQLAVGQTRLPGGGIDACDPELPHLALAAAPVAVRVRERMEHRLVGGAKEQLLGKAEALGPIEDRLVAPMRRDSAFDACHLRSRELGELLCGPPGPLAASWRNRACASSTCAREGGSSMRWRASACRSWSPGFAWRNPCGSSS